MHASNASAWSRRHILAASLSMLVPAGAAAQNLSFAPPVVSPIPVGADAVVTADFNNDGENDVATANATSSTVSVHLGAHGTFPNRAQIPVGARPVSIQAVDIDHDHDADLLVASLDSSTVTIVLNLGAGEFRAGTSLPVGGGPVSLAVGDFNRDGHIDFVTANSRTSTVSIRLGTGTGEFGAVRTYATGSRPQAVVSADFNRDGRPDLAIANGGSSDLSIRLGLGDGRFGSARRVATDTLTSDIVAGDFTRDGIPDIAVASFSLIVLPGTGTGAFGPPVTRLTTDAAYQRIVAADFNGDASLDLALVTDPTRIEVVWGFEGRFSASSSIQAKDARSLAVADFDRDGKHDLVMGGGSGRLAMFRNTTAFRASGTAYRAGGAAAAVAGRLATEDFNRDGAPDLMSPVSDGGAIVLGNADGTLGRRFDSLFGECGSDAGDCFDSAIVAGDFNRDGRIDLARALHREVPEGSEPESTLAVRLGRSDGTFAVAPTASVPHTTRLVVADFSNDGKLDLVGAGESSPGYFLPGLGNGSFGAPVPADAVGGGISSDFSGPHTQAGDVNGDGAQDLVSLIGHESSTVCVDLGRGDGTFVQGPCTGGFGDNTDHLAMGDFNRDGVLDVATADLSFNLEAISVLLGRGDGTFVLKVVRIANLPSDTRDGGAVIAGDFNRDGRPDLAIGIAAREVDGTFATRGAVEILHGRGDGTFSSAIRFNVPTSPMTLTTADFNRDGKLDLAAGGASGTDAVVMLNTPSVAVTSPNTPVNWGIGSVQPIEWSHTLGAGAPFRIELSRDGGVSWRVLAEVASAGSTSSRFRWTVDEAATVAARIRVVSPRHPADADVGNVNFTISAPFIAITAPATAVTWRVGTTHTILWSHNLGIAATARIEISRNGGLSWSTIASAVPHVGTTSSRFIWTVAGPATVSARLRVSWTADPAVNALNPATFTIASSAPSGPIKEIVMHMDADVEAIGTWSLVTDPSAAAGIRAYDRNLRAPKAALPAGQPASYLRIGFTADPTQTYKLWMRLKADFNSWASDSVWVQFSGAADSLGNPVYRVGTTSGLWVSLEECTHCGLSGWGWQDDGWGAIDRPGVRLRFPQGGRQVLLIQTREDGVSIDQIVLSSEKFLTVRPGAARNDLTIVPRPE